MIGKHVVVTGPTSGIGLEIAIELAMLGAGLTLACRDAARGARAADLIRHASGTAAAIEVMLVDTSSQASVRAFARAFRASHERLDVLINNAGTSEGERRLSADGIELTFATNVLGYFLLTNELLEVLARTNAARIVNVASQFAGSLDLDDLQFERRPFDGLAAYAQSKACNRLLTWELARRLDGTRVTANAYAPGFVPGTGLSRNLRPDVRESLRARPGRTAAQGADTGVWLASSRDVEGVSGRLFMDRREIPCELKGPATEARLWSACERLVGP